LEFRLETSLENLQSAIHAVASTLATAKGVEVKETRLELTAPSARVLEFRIACTVKAMIMSASLVARGRAEIGDDLCARIAEIALEGDGMIASLARSVIEPKLAALRSGAYPLAELKIPGLTVRDVEVSAGETIRLTVRLMPAA
jgi:hypothetical protein